MRAGAADAGDKAREEVGLVYEAVEFVGQGESKVGARRSAGGEV